MKIIWVDGYDRETVAQRLVAENIKSDAEAKVMLDALRENCKGNHSQWYEIKPDDYRLWRGMADLIDDDEPLGRQDSEIPATAPGQNGR